MYKTDDQIRQTGEQLATAYDAVREYFKSGVDPDLRASFMVAPVAPDNVLLGQQPIEWVLRHGIIVSMPNKPDDQLSPEALAARERAVAVGMQAMQTVTPRADAIAATRLAQVQSIRQPG